MRKFSVLARAENGSERYEYARLPSRYVDRSLEGAKYGELSVAQPTRFPIPNAGDDQMGYSPFVSAHTKSLLERMLTPTFPRIQS
jgi:hypothetical protein